MLYNIAATVFSLIIPLLVVKKDIKKDKNLKTFIKSNRNLIIIYIVLIIGFMVRLIGIVDHPNGLNVDEASIGYEAYAVSNYGIDRNGKSWPIFLEAWGSGQNALYMYIIMPFVKIMGLSILSVRLPMAIIGCISLIIMYKILSQTKDETLSLIRTMLFCNYTLAYNEK